MTDLPRRVRGAATYAAVFGVALALGAGGAWVARGHARGHIVKDAVTTHGEWVKIPRGSEVIRAYVAYPERKTKAPAVIVIHEIFGLTDWEPTVVDRLAKEGFVAIVPDLLSSKYGMSPANPDSGRKLIARARARAHHRRPRRHLRLGQRAAGGARRSHRHDRLLLGRRAELPLRHQQPEPPRRRRLLRPAARLRRDQADQGPGARHLRRERRPHRRDRCPPSWRRCNRLGRRSRQEVYPGTGHGFLKPGREGSDGPQPAKAWTRILEFYRARLGK